MDYENDKNRNQYWFCCLPGPQWLLFCGISSVLIGALWLLQEAGILYEDIWDFVLPIILIVWGTAYIINHFRASEKG